MKLPRRELIDIFSKKQKFRIFTKSPKIIFSISPALNPTLVLYFRPKAITSKFFEVTKTNFSPIDTQIENSTFFLPLSFIPLCGLSCREKKKGRKEFKKLILARKSLKRRKFLTLSLNDALFLPSARIKIVKFEKNNCFPLSHNSNGANKSIIFPKEM